MMTETIGQYYKPQVQMMDKRIPYLMTSPCYKPIAFPDCVSKISLQIYGSYGHETVPNESKQIHVKNSSPHIEDL